MIAVSHGGEIKIIGGSTYGHPYQIISYPQYKSLNDLKGQRIAGASLASITTTIFKDVMRRQGVPPSEYNLLFVGGSPERFQAVNSGQVAASLAEAPPFNFKSIDAGRKVLSIIPIRSKTYSTLPFSCPVGLWRRTGPCSFAT